MEAVDALPYIDRDIDEDPAVRRKVEGLLRAEMATFNPTASYLSTLQAQDASRAFHSSARIRASLEKLEAGDTLEPFNKQRFALVSPEAGEEEVSRWTEAVSRLKKTIEYQRSWLVTAQLCRKYGPMAWKVNAKVQEGLVEQAKFQLEQSQAREEQANKQRKAAQLAAKPELEFLSKEALDIARKNFLILKKLRQAAPDTAAKRAGEKLNGADPKRLRAE